MMPRLLTSNLLSVCRMPSRAGRDTGFSNLEPQKLDNAFRRELSESKCGVQDFLKRRNPAWNLVGRVHFNLAENRKDEDTPFAFLATYTTRLSTNSSGQTKAQHLPLGQAL